MKNVLKLIVAVAALASANAFAQMPAWNDSQEAVWAYVAKSWEDDVAENGRWPAEYTHASYVGWGDTDVAPRGRDAEIAWNRFQDGRSTVIWHEINPLAIAVAERTAVVMYYATMIVEDEDEETERVMLGIVETLIRHDGGWKYLSSTGFSPDHDD